MKQLSRLYVTMLPATFDEGERVAIVCKAFNRNVVVPYDYRKNNAAQVAEAFLDSNGVVVEGYTWETDGYILYCSSLQPLSFLSKP